jgi:hypothetical protein
MDDFWLSSRVRGVVEEEEGLGRGLEGVVFQRLAREEGRCTVWAGLIRHAARGDDRVWDVARWQDGKTKDGKIKDDADGDGGWMTDDDLVVVWINLRTQKKNSARARVRTRTRTKTSVRGVFCVCVGKGDKEEKGGGLCHESVRLQEARVARVKLEGRGPFRFPFSRRPDGFPSMGLSQFKNLANVPGCQAPTRPEHSARTRRGDSVVCRLSSFGCRLSFRCCSCVWRLILSSTHSRRKRGGGSIGTHGTKKASLFLFAIGVVMTTDLGCCDGMRELPLEAWNFQVAGPELPCPVGCQPPGPELPQRLLFFCSSVLLSAVDSVEIRRVTSL